MAYSWYKVKHLTTSQINNMDDSMTDSMLKDMLDKLHSRERQYSKEGRMFYSAAYENLKNKLEIWDEGDIYDKKIGQKKRAIRLLENFFNRQSSSVKGARKIMIEQDKMLADFTGQPYTRMTRSERDAFWALADEYERTPDSKYANNYEKIWNYITDMVFEASDKDNPKSMREIARKSFVTADRLDKLKELLEEELKNAPPEPDTEFNIYSGKWYDKRR